MVDEWCTDLRTVRRLRRSTLRSYQVAVRLFCAYLTDPAYDWPQQCQRRFGTHPIQVVHEWNAAVHAQQAEADPSKRAFTVDELQAFFDHADAQVARRMEYAGICGEKFECPPPLLPEKLGFDSDRLGDPEGERETLERLTAERERIGPVNLVAESELAELPAESTMTTLRPRRSASATPARATRTGSTPASACCPANCSATASSRLTPTPSCVPPSRLMTANSTGSLLGCATRC